MLNTCDGFTIAISFFRALGKHKTLQKIKGREGGNPDIKWVDFDAQVRLLIHQGIHIVIPRRCADLMRLRIPVGTFRSGNIKSHIIS